jgi:hypothetical protein
LAATIGVLLLLSFGAQFLPFNKSETVGEANVDQADKKVVNQVVDTIYIHNTIATIDTIYIDRVKIIPKIVYLEKGENKSTENIAKSVLGKQNEMENLSLDQKKQESNVDTKDEVLTKSTSDNRSTNTNLRENLRAFSLVALNKKSFSLLNITSVFPRITYQNPSLKYPEPARKEPKTPLAERLSVGILLGGSQNQLFVKNTSTQGGYKPGYDINANVGINIGKRWNFRTGFTFDNGSYAVNTTNKQVLYAEEISGSPKFVYITPFGNAVVPNEMLNFTPKIGDNITVESENENRIGFWKIPFTLSYDFFDRDLLFLGSYKKIKLNAFGGGFLSIPSFNQSNVEIYEPDGEDFYTKLTDFKGISNLAFGGSLGLGSKIYLKRKLSFVTEASVYRNATFLVNNEFYQSTPQGARLRVGFSYDLK